MHIHALVATCIDYCNALLLNFFINFSFYKNFVELSQFFLEHLPSSTFLQYFSNYTGFLYCISIVSIVIFCFLRLGLLIISLLCTLLIFFTSTPLRALSDLHSQLFYVHIYLFCLNLYFLDQTNVLMLLRHMSIFSFRTYKKEQKKCLNFCKFKVALTLEKM